MSYGDEQGEAARLHRIGYPAEFEETMASVKATLAARPEELAEMAEAIRALAEDDDPEC